jgi:type IV pilus assembly protein PilO
MEQLLEKFAKAPPAVKYGGLGGVIVVLTLLNFLLLVQPVEAKIAATVNQQRELDAKYAEKRDLAENLNERKREMEVLEQKLTEALTELPEKKELEELLAQLNDIGRKSGLEIARVEPGVETASGFFARIPVKMVVSGNFHEVAMFLQEVSNMRRIVNVNELGLTMPVVRGDKVVLKSEFMATTFRFLDANEAADKGKAKK